MAVNFLTEIARDIGCHLHLFLTHHSEAAMSCRTGIVSRDVHFDVVYPFTTTQADNLLYLLCTVGDHAETFVIHMRFALVAETACDCDLRARRTNTRPGKFACIDCIADDDIEP